MTTLTTNPPGLTLEAVWLTEDALAVMVSVHHGPSTLIEEGRIDGLLAQVADSATGTVTVGPVTLDESSLVSVREVAVLARAAAEAGAR